MWHEIVAVEMRVRQLKETKSIKGDKGDKIVFVEQTGYLYFVHEKKINDDSTEYLIVGRTNINYRLEPYIESERRYVFEYIDH